jgi:hypothetical protein
MKGPTLSPKGASIATVTSTSKASRDKPVSTIEIFRYDFPPKRIGIQVMRSDGGPATILYLVADDAVHLADAIRQSLMD